MLLLLRRESALLLCKRIPLQTVYAWAASVALLQCKGLNLTSASVIGNWTASFADRLLLIYRRAPFCAVCGRDLPKRGATATSAQTLTFFQALDPFLSRERPRSSEKGATATSAPIFTIFQALDPFLSRERPGSSTEGSFNLTSN